MDHNQILDEFNEKPLFPAVLSRFRWYCIHATLVLSLNLIVLFILLLLVPLLPASITNSVMFALIFIVMFGMTGITVYVCYKGCKWHIIGALIGGLIMFMCCFVFIMNYLTMLKIACREKFELWFNISHEYSGDILELILVGIGYSILIIPFCEIIVLITVLTKPIRKAKESEKPLRR